MKVFYNNFIAQFLLAFLLSTNIALALSPEEKLYDEAQENRAMELFLQVRCLVCNGQVIENSDTKFAYDMRKFIRDEIRNGKSDEEIKKNLINTFGNDILTTPTRYFILSFLIISLVISAIICHAILNYGRLK